MQYRNFGKLDIRPSALGFGAMRLPCVGGGNAGGDVDMDEAVRMIRYAIDHGVNYIDTAYPYHDGNSEVAVGRALKDGYREKVMLADKSPTFYIKKETDFDEMLETQLRRLDDEHIDLYLLHSLNGGNLERVVKKFDLIGKAERAKKAGKIGHIGFSFHDNYEAFHRILEAYDGWEFCQIQLNYLDEKKQAGVKGLREAAARGMGVVIMEPLMGGKLAMPPQQVLDIFARSDTKRTPVQWALDFLWDMPDVSVVLSGMSTMQQTMENIRYAQDARPGMLTGQDQQIIADVQKQFAAMITVPCTGCGYCVPCPQKVNIPQNFSILNDISLYDDPEVARNNYKHLLMWSGKDAVADSCIGCGVCEEKCPQQIKISEWMPRVAQATGKIAQTL